MNSYSLFPPFDYFKRVLQTSPGSALIYASIWKLKSKSKCLVVEHKDIKKNFLISPTLFRNHLLALGRLELISFDEDSNSFRIDFKANEKK